MSIVRLQNISKAYGNHLVLENINLDIEPGKITVLTGPSGAGKSTLLNIIGLLDMHTKGDFHLFDCKNVKPYSKKAIKLLRDKIGFIFQNYALLDNGTVEQNLMIALKFVKNKDKKQLIQKALERVGLPGFQTKKIYECSGGEQQRIAIARLLLKPCELVLADEPTGSLDDANRVIVFNLLKELQKAGKTIIIVSHDDYIIDRCDIQIPLKRLQASS